MSWSHENKEALTSLQKDFGMRQGGLQELLSTGGFIAGQPPAGGETTESVHDVFKGIQ